MKAALTQQAFDRKKLKPAEPLAPEVLERAIIQISAAVTKLRATRLRDSTVVLLISHASGIGQRDTRAVLDAMQSLEATYLKPTRKSG